MDMDAEFIRFRKRLTALEARVPTSPAQAVGVRPFDDIFSPKEGAGLHARVGALEGLVKETLGGYETRIAELETRIQGQPTTNQPETPPDTPPANPAPEAAPAG